MDTDLGILELLDNHNLNLNLGRLNRNYSLFRNSLNLPHPNLVHKDPHDDPHTDLKIMIENSLIANHPPFLYLHHLLNQNKKRSILNLLRLPRVGRSSMRCVDSKERGRGRGRTLSRQPDP
jgi:hypothetical protein